MGLRRHPTLTRRLTLALDEADTSSDPVMARNVVYGLLGRTVAKLNDGRKKRMKLFYALDLDQRTLSYLGSEESSRLPQLTPEEVTFGRAYSTELINRFQETEAPDFRINNG